MPKQPTEVNEFGLGRAGSDREPRPARAARRRQGPWPPAAPSAAMPGRQAHPGTPLRNRPQGRPGPLETVGNNLSVAR